MRSRLTWVLRKVWLFAELLLFSLRARSEPQAEAKVEPSPADQAVEPTEPEGASEEATSDLQSVSIDDFDTPDEASFEPLWDAGADPNLTFTSPHCSLDLAAGAHRQPIGESFYVSVTLSMPLRGCRAVRAPIRSLSAPAPAHAKLVAFDVDERGGVSAVPQARPPEAVASASEAQTHQSMILQPLPRGFLAELRRRVLSARGVERSEERIDQLIRRERTAGLLPELRLRGAHGFDQSLASASTGALPGQSTTRGASDLLVEARLTFRLQRLALGDGEVALERQRQSLIEKGHDALEEALDQLLVFRRASALALDPDRDPERALDARLLAEGARIRLHVLTAGWFPLEGPLPGEPNNRRD